MGFAAHGTGGIDAVTPDRLPCLRETLIVYWRELLKAILIPALLILLPASLCSTGYAQSEEGYWNQYRGPNEDGKTGAKGLPVEFGETKHVRWKTAIPGIGFSSPVLWDDQIWLTTAPPEGDEVYAVGVDLHSGKIIHNIKVFDIVPRDFINPFDENRDASPTPVVEQGRVYVYFGTNGTACLDTKTGEKIWERRDFECDHDIRPGSSPIIDGDSLIVAFDGRDIQYLVALDKHTGDTLWRRDREIVFENEDVPYNKAFSTARIFEHEGRRQLISIAATAAISYVPETGEELWRVRHRGTNSSCRPLFAHGLVYFVTGQAVRSIMAVRPSGNGDVTDTHIAWTVKKNPPEFTSQLIVDDLLFMVSSTGVATCLEAKTGREVWRQRLGGHYYWASPLYAAGKIYFFSKEGVVSVISASGEFHLLSENTFDDGFWASPAVTGDALILRSLSHLYRIEE